jgi:hypothetical protein
VTRLANWMFRVSEEENPGVNEARVTAKVVDKDGPTRPLIVKQLGNDFTAVAGLSMVGRYLKAVRRCRGCMRNCRSSPA